MNRYRSDACSISFGVRNGNFGMRVRQAFHRINLTRYDLDNFINGNVGAMIDAFASHHQAELLNKQG